MVLIWLLLGTCGLPGAGRAQVAQEEAERFRGHLQRALALFQAQRYEESIAELAAAQAIRQEPRLLLNLGHAYRHLGRAEEALRHYQRFLDASPDLPAAERDIVASYMAQVRPKEGVTPPPPPAAAEPVARPSPALPLTPDTPVRPVRPAPSPVPPLALGATPAARGQTRQPGQPGQKGRPWWFWGLLGLGTASVVTVAVVSARPWDSGLPPGIPLHDAQF
jgi:tetratricopeptide (TPR) repeat protein